MSQENIDGNNGVNYSDGYDSFEIMVAEISRFKNQYHSFTTDKTYTDLLGKTASGLLKDAAAETAKLSLEQRKQHEYSLNVFAAFCMYFCVTKLKAKYGNKDHSLAGDIVSTVYGRILKRIRKDLEETGESLYVRNLIKCSADNAMKDIDRTEKRHVKPVIAGASNAIHNSEKLGALERAIAKAARQKILTKDELLAICHFYGYGNGFKQLSNHEIAQKLGCSDSAATKLRQNALKKLHDFLRETPEFNERFL